MQPVRRATGVVVALAVAAAVVAVAGAASAPAGPAGTTEVVVTMKAPPLSAFGARSLASADYVRRIAAANVALERNVLSAVPGAKVRWRYRTVLNGFAVVVPRSAVARLEHVPGVDRVWRNARYHALLDRSPRIIGADKLWGANLETAGQGMKIAIIDDGVDASHPFFNPAGYTYPAGFPKGQTGAATPKVIVQRAFAPPTPTWKNATRPFDPENSFHATHVAGIAAGNPNTVAAGRTISGVAPRAYIGNYKALTIPTPSFGLDGNSAEIAAAIEAAVKDGMNVINLSLGEPEVEPSRDLVVRALEGAAAAGVIPVVAAGNDFGDFGYGSVGSPANTPSAITVAASTKGDAIASFSSAGPTTVSLAMKPDVTAPGVDIFSSLPAGRGGPWGVLQGTSMAAPHVAGSAALLKERHPSWTVAQVKSALVQTGSPVRGDGGGEALAVREGGGRVTLTRADAPLLFAAPTGLSFGMVRPGTTVAKDVTLSDAGGGAGDWTVTTAVQQGPASVTTPATVTVPGRLTVTAVAGAAPGDASGFVTLTRGTDVRRIPFWIAVSQPQLAAERRTALAKPGVYRSSTAGAGASAAAARVSVYRYPTGDDTYPGPERVYRVSMPRLVANFGVVVLSGRAVPHIVLAGDESRLAGYTALPVMLNPYLESYGTPRSVSGVVLPARGAYDVVFDTRAASDAGAFTFRYWVNDTVPPKLRVVSATRGRIVVSVTDGGSGVDPASLSVKLDGNDVQPKLRSGRLTIAAARGTHRLVVRASDFQESKNMEDVPRILPNTATLSASVRVR
jgi:subtilisin family serine protease